MRVEVVPCDLEILQGISDLPSGRMSTVKEMTVERTLVDDSTSRERAGQEPEQRGRRCVRGQVCRGQVCLARNVCWVGAVPAFTDL